jgi:hypothetical protein
MATNPDPIHITSEMWRLWESASQMIPGVKLSGIYANKSGYHNTVNKNRSTWPSNYSIKLPLDLPGYNYGYARAIDLTMSDTEMVKWTTRMKNSALNPADTRLRCMREFYGTLDNRSVYGLIKDNLDGPWRRSSADDTHLWHGHGSVFTKFVADWNMLYPLLSVWSGQPWEDYKVGDFLPNQGASGEHAVYWQNRHNLVRFMVAPESPALVVDGDYGPSTATAFKDMFAKLNDGAGSYTGSYMSGWLANQYDELIIQRRLRIANLVPAEPVNK